MRKIIGLALILACLTTVAMAQSSEMFMAVRKLLKVNENIFRSNEFRNKTFLFSMSMKVNNFGRIDTVIFGGTNKNIDRLYNLNLIVKGLKANKENFKNYKNEFLTYIIVLVRGEKSQIKIDNGSQYLESWQDIAKSLSYIQGAGKRNIFLGPIVLHFSGKMSN